MKLTLLSAMLMTAVVGITSANAADYKKNPFTLVYDGAITENVAGKVNIHPVKYDLHGIQIAANVYTPANYDPAKKYPAIVVAHPNGALKSRSPVCMRSALLSMAILLLPPMQLIRGLAVGCHVTWINLRIVLKISTVWLISSASILVLIAPVLVCWGFAGEEGIHLLPPRRRTEVEFFYRNGREVRNHNVLIYLCVDVNGEVKDLHRQFNIIYIMRTNINQGRIQSLAVHDCSAH